MPKDVLSPSCSRYGPKTSAYRSGAMAKCRKVGAANWEIRVKEDGGFARQVMSDRYNTGNLKKKK